MIIRYICVYVIKKSIFTLFCKKNFEVNFVLNSPIHSIAHIIILRAQIKYYVYMRFSKFEEHTLRHFTAIISIYMCTAFNLSQLYL